MARLCSKTQHHGALPIKWVALTLLLLPLCTQNQATAARLGSRCQSYNRCFFYFFLHRCFTVWVCVPQPPTMSSCEDVSCPGSTNGHPDVCALIEDANCAAPPCQPEQVCIPDLCADRQCSEPGAVCVTRYNPDSAPDCSPYPECRFRSACVPRLEDKPGSCPASMFHHVTTGSNCYFDNDCPSTLLCCWTFFGYAKCMAPRHS